MNPGAETFSVQLSRDAAAGQPWGFRLQGGADFATPLSVQSVSSAIQNFFYPAVYALDATSTSSNVNVNQCQSIIFSVA